MRRFLAPLARRIGEANLLARSVIRRDSDLTMPPVVARPPEPLLLIAPHADDESIGCGGLLALSDRATVVLLTGSALRREETARALAVLGLSDVVALDLEDQKVGQSPSLHTRIAELLERFAPATVLVPYPLDRHRDHVAAARAVAEASPSCEIWCYEVWSPLEPNRLVDISGVADMKRRAIGEHRSQVSGHAYADAALGLNAYRSLLAPGAKFAEAYLKVSLDQLRQLLGDDR
jgi:N-acetylglucosamine malate deacetylase 1